LSNILNKVGAEGTFLEQAGRSNPLLRRHGPILLNFPLSSRRKAGGFMSDAIDHYCGYFRLFLRGNQVFLAGASGKKTTEATENTELWVEESNTQEPPAAAIADLD
jgi:hypothetical protein